MKRTVLAAIAGLSLAVVALPAASGAHSTSAHAAREHRPDDRGANHDRRDDGRGEDEHAPSCVAELHRPGTAGRDAERHVSHGHAAWDEVELGR